MTVATEQTTAQFNNVVVGVPLNCDFPCFDQAHVTVLLGLVGQVAVLDTDYTVQLNDTGGYVDFTVTPLQSMRDKIDAILAANPNEEDKTTVTRNVPLTTDMTPTKAQFRQQISDEFDRSVLRDQQISRDVDAAIRLPETRDPAFDPTFSPVPETAPFVSADGLSIENVSKEDLRGEQGPKGDQGDPGDMSGANAGSEYVAAGVEELFRKNLNIPYADTTTYNAAQTLAAIDDGDVLRGDTTTAGGSIVYTLPLLAEVEEGWTVIPFRNSILDDGRQLVLQAQGADPINGSPGGSVRLSRPLETCIIRKTGGVYQSLGHSAPEQAGKVPTPPDFGCVLVRTSDTVLTLRPVYPGAGLWIDGQFQVLRSPYPTIENGSWNANEARSVFAYMNGNTIELMVGIVDEGWVIDPTYGYAIRNTDPTRTAVGAARANAVQQFQHTAAYLGVRSLYNEGEEQRVGWSDYTGTGITVTSNGLPVVVTGGPGVEMLMQPLEKYLGWLFGSADPLVNNHWAEAFLGDADGTMDGGSAQRIGGAALIGNVAGAAVRNNPLTNLKWRSPNVYVIGDGQVKWGARQWSSRAGGGIKTLLLTASRV